MASFLKLDKGKGVLTWKFPKKELGDLEDEPGAHGMGLELVGWEAGIGMIGTEKYKI
jgi:hypothetical protein